ncbi:MAG: phosphoserine phosphatase SerB [Thermoplasmatota archaeon]
MDPAADRLVALSAMGTSKPTLMADLSGCVSALGGNIVHVEQATVHGLFTCFMFVEPGDLPPGLDLYRLAYEVTLRGKDLGLDVKAEVVPRSAASPQEKDLRVVTILGSDRLGVMHAITKAIADHGANIDRMRHSARGDLMAFEIVIDVAHADFATLRDAIRETCERVGVDAVVQPHELYGTRRRLVVFDMDSTIVDGEVIDEVAKAAGVGGHVAAITERAMRGELDFEQALRERVRLLKGLPVRELGRIANSLQLTPGTYDLLAALKSMGFKIALVSGGFSFFTDRLKERLGFDYAFGNELVIEDGKVTGEIRGDVIDAARKGEILKMLAQKEGLGREEVIAIGDGANDRIMVRNAGLGIAFNAKEILKRAADGSLTKQNLRGLLFALGATDQDLRRLEQQGNL